MYFQLQKISANAIYTKKELDTTDVKTYILATSLTSWSAPNSFIWKQYSKYSLIISIIF